MRRQQIEIHVLTSEGDRVLAVPDSEERSSVARHANAVARYARGDDPTGAGLRRFRNKQIGRYRLVDDRDLDLIDEFLQRGDLDWPDLYEHR
jgi:hypothetical protein